MKTESEVVIEGFNAYMNGGINPYVRNSWAFYAWLRGYNAASDMNTNKD